MSEWMPIERWAECAEMTRSRVIFEIRNRDDQRLQSRCVQPVPSAPIDWRSPAIEFRVIEEPAARRSEPIPAPRQ